MTTKCVGRTPDQRVMHCWVKGYAGVSRGQPKAKLLRNVLWLPNLPRNCIYISIFKDKK